MNTTGTTDESKNAGSQVLDTDNAMQEGTSTTRSTTAPDASKLSDQPNGDPVLLTEQPTSPPPPRRKSATLVLPSDETVPVDPSGTSATRSQRSHMRTNTFGAISKF